MKLRILKCEIVLGYQVDPVLGGSESVEGRVTTEAKMGVFSKHLWCFPSSLHGPTIFNAFISQNVFTKLIIKLVFLYCFHKRNFPQ